MKKAGNNCDGARVPGLPPVEINGTENVTICAKRGGPSFMNTTRVDPALLRCPSGFSPCSRETKHTETICLEPERIPTDCPIIDMMLVKESEALSWQADGYTVIQSPRFVPIKPDQAPRVLAFTKDKFRNYVSGGPIMEIITNTQNPCFGNSKQSLRLTKMQIKEHNRFDFEKI